MKVSNTIKSVALMLSAISLTACATPSQVYWDHKVKELCEKYGGVTVYEKVELTRQQFEMMKDFQGAVRAPVEKYAKPDDILISTSKREILHEGNPTVDRIETKIFRRSDMKLLGYEVSYARIGGDLAPIDNPSSFSCGDIDGFIGNINRLIYTIKGD